MTIRAQSPIPDQQQNPYLPPGPEPLVFDQFQGINTSTSRMGVKDAETWWLDGFFPIGPRFLRTLPGIGTRLWQVSDSSEPAGTTISFFDFANIGSTPYCIAILSNGSIYAINTATRVATRIAAAMTITNPSRLTTGMCQYGSQYVIIVSQQTNGYFIWDGTTFYKPGNAFPPESANIPTGISGSAVETYAGRIWIANNATIFFSAPVKPITDYSSPSGGGEFTSSDSFLRNVYVALKQSNGFLYLIGDSSTNYISGVQTTAGVTTFTNQNADPEVGSPWPGSVNVFGRNIVFANTWGVHISYGAAVSKISEPLDGIYSSVSNLGGFFPSAAKAIIFGKKVWMLLLPVIDPFTGAQANKLFLWNSRLWFAATQDVNLQFIAHQELASILTAWGTDGSAIWPLFINPSAAITKVAMSRLWETPVGYHVLKAATRLYGLIQYFTPVSNTITVRIDNEIGGQSYNVTTSSPTLTWVNNNSDPIAWLNNSLNAITWSGASGEISAFDPTAVGQKGLLTGMTFTTQCPDLALLSMMLQDEIVGGRY